jgi:serine protease Do
VKDGDIITKLDGQPVAKVTEFRAAIAQKRPGTIVELEVWRDGKIETLEVELGEAAGSVTLSERGPGPQLGIALSDVNPQLQQRFSLGRAKGVVIVEVHPGSPAAHAGLRPGELLEQVGNHTVESAAQAKKLLEQANLEKGVRLRVSSGGVGRFVFIKTK